MTPMPDGPPARAEEVYASTIADLLAGVRQVPERGPLRDEYVRGWCRAQKLRRLGLA